MNSVRKCEVLIVGAGPAGAATALYLLKQRPELAGHIVAIEKSAHPRFKVCAGGLIPKTTLALEELGIELDAPAVEVIRGEARTALGKVDLSRDGDVLCTVIRRDRFDAQLAHAAKEAGLEIVEHTRVRNAILPDANGHRSAERVQVETDRGIYDASIVVGADGSGSIVRRAVFGKNKTNIGRALMADIAVNPERTAEFLQRRYVFDFRCIEAGIKGYGWSFPCLIDGRPHLNVGIYDQHPRESKQNRGEQSLMIEQLARSFPNLPLDQIKNRNLAWHAFPIRWFDGRDRYRMGRVILAGDAAGVDPLMGEGISCAFEHGKIAARAIEASLAGDADALAEYDRTLHEGMVGRKLAKLSFAARHFYGPKSRMFFRIAGVSRRAQEIGVDWYNGAGHLDELPTRRLMARWIRSVLLGAPVR